MANEVVYTGTAPNNNTGDPLREAFAKINQRFVALAAGLSPDALNIVERVETARDEAEISEDAAAVSAAIASAAANAATVSADVYPDVATGLAAMTVNGQQFQVVSGSEVIRYKRVTASTATVVARYPTSATVLGASVSDFNAITTTGLYTGTNATGAPLASTQTTVWHVETGRAYQLAVTQRTSAAGSARQWFRYRSSTGWDAWLEVSTKSDLDAMRAAIGEYGTSALSATENWNNITVSGVYRNGNTGPIGGPITQANLLLQHVEGLSPRAAQVCFDSVSNRQWRRVRSSSNAWSAWTELDPDQALLATNLDTITVSGIYRSDSAVGQPVAAMHTLTIHSEGASGRGYQIAQWGLFQPSVTGNVLRMRSATRFRLSDGTWSAWEQWFTTGLPRRVVDTIPGTPHISAGVARVREPMSAFLESAFDDIYTTAAGMNARYRQLVADFPDYVSEQSLGNDTAGNPIWSLTFAPAGILGGRAGYPANALQHKKIIVTSGIHPIERESMVANLCAFDSLCRNWRDDEMLTWLRWNVRIVLIPVVNPSGVNAGHTRTNHNGVDLNRNFPTRWSSADTNPGPSAGSEAETQLVIQWLTTHSDACAHIDVHSHGNVGYPLWIIANSPTLGTVEKIAREQHAWMRREILSEEANASRYAVSPLSGGMMATHADETLGLKSHVLEGPIYSDPALSAVPNRTKALMNATAIIRSIYEWSRA